MLKKIGFLALAAVVMTVSSCKKSEDDPAPVASDPYSDVNTSYETAFKNSSGVSTVDRKDGRIRLAMLKSLDSVAKLPNSGTIARAVTASELSNMFNNTSSPFGNPGLNTSGLTLRSATAVSTSDPAVVRSTMEDNFFEIATASTSFAVEASKGNAGYLANNTSRYLVDKKGIEYAQVISKSFIGAFQLDYIANVLLSDNSISNANNTDLVAGKTYTQLEHRWDEAYGILTTKDRYAQDATATANGGESFLGSYVWEYNKEAYPKLHLAFLKGRKAIADKDRAAAKVQAQYIRRELEKTIAKAALGYLGKYTAGSNAGQKAHAIGEGLGFIYSLRFCKLNGADAQFSDDVLNNLIYNSTDGFWDLDSDKIDAAEEAISAKFGL